ncbi:hypothetical protein BDV12DRAFT_192761 [Aspergillus spectabilis]
MAPRTGKRKPPGSTHSDSTIQAGLSGLGLGSVHSDERESRGQKRRSPDRINGPADESADEPTRCGLPQDADAWDEGERERGIAAKKRRFNESTSPPAPPNPPPAPVVPSPASTGPDAGSSDPATDQVDWGLERIKMRKGKRFHPVCDICMVTSRVCDDAANTCTRCQKLGVPCEWTCNITHTTYLRGVVTPVMPKPGQEAAENRELAEQVRLLSEQAGPAIEALRDLPSKDEWQQVTRLCESLQLENNRLKKEILILNKRNERLQADIQERKRKYKEARELQAVKNKAAAELQTESNEKLRQALRNARNTSRTRTNRNRTANTKAAQVTAASDPTATPAGLAPGPNPHTAAPPSYYPAGDNTAMTLPGWAQPEGGMTIDLTQDDPMPVDPALTNDPDYYETHGLGDSMMQFVYDGPPQGVAEQGNASPKNNTRGVDQTQTQGNVIPEAYVPEGYAPASGWNPTQQQQ